MEQLKTILSTLEASVREKETDLPSLIGELEKLKALAWGQLYRPEPAKSTSPPDSTRYLNVEEVCTRFNVTPKWLYRHKKQLPHSQPSRKVLLFPEARLCQWFERRKAS